MDIALQQIIDSGVDQPVPSHGGDPAKRFRHDPNSKVALAPARAGMACMQVTFILHVELGGIKAFLQSFTQNFRANGCGSIRCALIHAPGGSDGAAVGAPRPAFVLPLSHRTCGNMKIIVAGVIPYTLKCTQVLSVKFRAT